MITNDNCFGPAFVGVAEKIGSCILGDFTSIASLQGGTHEVMSSTNFRIPGFLLEMNMKRRKL